MILEKYLRYEQNNNPAKTSSKEAQYKGSGANEDQVNTISEEDSRTKHGGVVRGNSIWPT